MARTDPGSAEYQAVVGRVAKVATLANLLVLVAIFFMVTQLGA